LSFCDLLCRILYSRLLVAAIFIFGSNLLLIIIFYPFVGKELESVILLDLEYCGVAYDYKLHYSDSHFYSTGLSQVTTGARDQ
jgi:hypothetical protein